ncbi:hypothetical protein AB1Y20_017042 [Prymnesium parvum]|uniref:Uncharacterized protein n=1 Tax=Prymnesium parvum TaxID=97485 RepID=A0AB34IBJ4_PRYPA
MLPQVERLEAHPHIEGCTVVSYTTEQAGQWLLDVALHSVAVRGSPYRLDVKADVACATSTTSQGAGLSRATRGSESAFVITAGDRFCNRCDEGGARFWATLSAMPESAARRGRPVADCEIVDCEDGTYLGLYTLPREAPSDCILRIFLDQEQIRGSPFQIAVS